MNVAELQCAKLSVVLCILYVMTGVVGSVKNY